jgi:hypothetical protein
VEMAHRGSCPSDWPILSNTSGGVAITFI